MVALSRSEDTAGTPFGFAAAAVVLRQAEAWTSAQCELLSGVEAMWTTWVQRQREAIDASARSLAEIYECREFADIVRIQQNWLADAVQRTTSDLSELADHAAALTWRLARVNNVGDVTRKPVTPTPSPRAQDEVPSQREAAE